VGVSYFLLDIVKFQALNKVIIRDKKSNSSREDCRLNISHTPFQQNLYILYKSNRKNACGLAQISNLCPRLIQFNKKVKV